VLKTQTANARSMRLAAKLGFTTEPVSGKGFGVEPPIGIEPMTYSLRVNRSSRLS
jgi:hypothetical protein